MQSIAHAGLLAQGSDVGFEVAGAVWTIRNLHAQPARGAESGFDRASKAGLRPAAAAAMPAECSRRAHHSGTVSVGGSPRSPAQKS